MQWKRKVVSVFFVEILIGKKDHCDPLIWRLFLSKLKAKHSTAAKVLWLAQQSSAKCAWHQACACHRNFVGISPNRFFFFFQHQLMIIGFWKRWSVDIIRGQEQREQAEQRQTALDKRVAWQWVVESTRTERSRAAFETFTYNAQVKFSSKLLETRKSVAWRKKKKRRDWASRSWPVLRAACAHVALCSSPPLISIEHQNL